MRDGGDHDTQEGEKNSDSDGPPELKAILPQWERRPAEEAGNRRGNRQQPELAGDPATRASSKQQSKQAIHEEGSGNTSDVNGSPNEHYQRKVYTQGTCKVHLSL